MLITLKSLKRTACSAVLSYLLRLLAVALLTLLLVGLVLRVLSRSKTERNPSRLES